MGFAGGGNVHRGEPPGNAGPGAGAPGWLRTAPRAGARQAGDIWPVVVSHSGPAEGEMRPSFRMTIAADPGHVAGVGATFAEFAEAHALPAAIRRSMSVALDELLNNTIVHGFAGREGEGGEVRIEVELRADRLCVTLSDDGRPFNPFGMAAPDTALPAEQRQIGGLGIHLVRRMMDEVSYHRRADRNVVILAKLLTGGTTGGEGRSGGRSMDIATRTHNDVTLVALAGNLDSNSSPQAQQALDAILAGGAHKLVVDFTALDYISSAGLRVLLGAAKRLSGTGGALRLFGLNETVREVFDISGFSTILAVFATEADALKGF
jgi:anti-anti-sigma factor